ncbi:hypothetical protein CEXT_734392, partial [Caerostris extrusa]
NLMLNHYWDDTEVNNAYKRLLKWNVGDFCRAVYSEDDLLYEAVILSIYEDSCTVKFLGYGDEEDVNLSTLERSLGELAREKQKKSAYYYYQNTKTGTNLMGNHDWDDTELIDAFSRLLVKKYARETAKNKALKKDEKEWNVGDFCRAVYSEDDLLYEAVILSIYEDSCTVKFLGYGDKEDVNLSTLERSLGKLAREKQKKSAYYYQNTKTELAVYSEDDLLYEAVILSIYEDSCTVEFLGYGDEEDVNLSTLKRSWGKLAREKQKKSAYYYYQNTKTGTESEDEETKRSYRKYSSYRKKQDEGNSTDVSSSFEDRKKKRHGRKMAKPNAASYANESFGTWGPHMPPLSYYAPSAPVSIVQLNFL